MFIRQALILSKTEKSDDELRAIVTTHPMAATLHGFYLTHDTHDEASPAFPPDLCRSSALDSIWVDERLDPWIDRRFDAPGFPSAVLRDESCSVHAQHRHELEQNWWKAVVALIRDDVPLNYFSYAVCYGEIEDEYDHPEQAWRDSLLAHFNYSPALRWALGIADSARCAEPGRAGHRYTHSFVTHERQMTNINMKDENEMSVEQRLSILKEEEEMPVDQWLAIRKEEALHVDPATAQVTWEHGSVLDPYGVYPPFEEDNIGRNYFARAPGSHVWVSFHDLPAAVSTQLWERLGRRGWHDEVEYDEEVRRLGVRSLVLASG